MDNITRTEEQPKVQTGENNTDERTPTTFTAEMRFIVTRNTRNVWMDEKYDSPPDLNKLTIFN